MGNGPERERERERRYMTARIGVSVSHKGVEDL
jgi:hypothetical protein